MQIQGDFSLLNQYIQEYLPSIEAELVRGIKRTASERLFNLHEMLAYHMGWEGTGASPNSRGKRIRPLLVLLSCVAAGGDWKRALPAASAVEFIHNFSLIHDDIEDNSPVRHGQPTVWKLWGVPQAINAGDALFALAHLEILQLEETISPAVAIRAAKILQQTCLHLTQGQYLDLSYEKRTDLTQDDYWPMVSGKTAALLAASTQLGALTAQAEVERQISFSEFGRYLGLAFQAQDDLLGIWGDSVLTGKSADSDLVTGKKSLPVLYGLAKKGAFAGRWFRGPISPDEVCHVANLLELEGGRSFSEQVAAQLTRQAHQALEATSPEEPAGRALRQLADKLLNRKA
jgi:geranylgeranyl diphosphate synthase, type I